MEFKSIAIGITSWSPDVGEWPARAAYAGVLILGGFLFWLAARHPAMSLVWAPWDFSGAQYIGAALALLWYWRGIALLPTETRPPVWSRAAFVLGVAAIYAVLQTHFDYMAQHMFFLNRVQHVVMHHLGPFLIALSWPGAAIRRGMPDWARRVAENRALGGIVRVLQQPVLAPFLFVGLFYLWLIPPIHFRAMLDARLYAVMNWSMVLDGLLFWFLVLDPRPNPPARISFGARAALSFAVMFPQILLGAVVTFSDRDLYPYYDLCGRLYPTISALNDQHIGGMVSWIPPAMMSVAGVLLVLNALRLQEDAEMEANDAESTALGTLATRWTGR